MTEHRETMERLYHPKKHTAQNTTNTNSSSNTQSMLSPKSDSTAGPPSFAIPKIVYETSNDTPSMHSQSDSIADDDSHTHTHSEYQSHKSRKSKQSKSKRKKSSILVEQQEKGSILISRTNTVSNSDRSRSSASNIKHKQSYISNASNPSVSSVSNVSSMSKLLHDYQEEEHTPLHLHDIKRQKKKRRGHGRSATENGFPILRNDIEMPTQHIEKQQHFEPFDPNNIVKQPKVKQQQQRR